MRLRHAPILVVVAAALLLGACGADEPAGGAGANGDGAKQAGSGGDGDGDKPAGKKSKSKQKTEPKDQPEPSFEGTVVSVKVSNGDVTFDPTEAAVGVGEKLRIEVTSDAADEVHVHGYDVTEDLKAGKRATIDLTADIPGVFEVELEQSHTPLFELTVQ